MQKPNQSSKINDRYGVQTSDRPDLVRASSQLATVFVIKWTKICSIFDNVFTYIKTAQPNKQYLKEFNDLLQS